ncbi:hypothetical protein PCH_Pc12g02860 [Penicillium rubens Wisconsin 54-1255]|uniref:Uncharacterized protein n=1 Tax=Penicillium rubens (strain ATCC 28089 / DSM 1075 / NRRL 1951 / Wisconsin 54-1255) TaxID=500485 RepID=B6H0C7_PENRW|nr:hypothetical protein PCH_Pc12g02860 [Penicillium rubens Wisconsin 54-1255]
MPVRKNQHGSVKDIRGAQGIQVNGPTGPKSRAVSVLDKVKETKWMNKKHTTLLPTMAAILRLPPAGRRSLSGVYRGGIDDYKTGTPLHPPIFHSYDGSFPTLPVRLFQIHGMRYMCARMSLFGNAWPHDDGYSIQKTLGTHPVLLRTLLNQFKIETAISIKQIRKTKAFCVAEILEDLATLANPAKPLVILLIFDHCYKEDPWTTATYETHTRDSVIPTPYGGQDSEVSRGPQAKQIIGNL